MYVYFKPDDSLGLASQFDGTYNVDKMLKKCYDTVCVFETILPVKELFLNYSLKKNKKALEELIHEPKSSTSHDTSFRES